MQHKVSFFFELMGIDLNRVDDFCIDYPNMRTENAPAEILNGVRKKKERKKNSD